jgi:hypothetical protein
MVRLVCRSAGEWQGLWACHDGVQADAHECSLGGNESGPAEGHSSSECGSARTIECRPSSFRMQAATTTVNTIH